MWPSNPDHWKSVINSLAVIALLLGILVLLLFIGRSTNGTYDACWACFDGGVLGPSS